MCRSMPCAHRHRPDARQARRRRGRPQVDLQRAQRRVSNAEAGGGMKGAGAVARRSLSAGKLLIQGFLLTLTGVDHSARPPREARRGCRQPQLNLHPARSRLPYDRTKGKLRRCPPGTHAQQRSYMRSCARSSMWLLVWPAAIASSVDTNQLQGLTPFNFTAASTSEAMRALAAASSSRWR